MAPLVEEIESWEMAPTLACQKSMSIIQMIRFDYGLANLRPDRREIVLTTESLIEVIQNKWAKTIVLHSMK